MKRILLFVLLQVFVFTSVGFGQFGLGKILDKVRKVSDLQLTEEEEIKLGAEISKKLRNYFGVQQDLEETRYVSLVGNLLVQESDRPNLPFHFIILDTPSINAFAAPGGYIHITRGALGTIRSEAELAGVLGHEIGHVTAKHTLDELKKMKSVQLAEDETSLTDNSKILEEVANRMFDTILKGFSRKQELESDEIGVELAAKLGYQERGLAEFLETLKVVISAENEKRGLSSSHPETNERIEKIDKQIAKNKLQDDSRVSLKTRYLGAIKYEFNPSEIAEFAEGVKGVAGGGKESEDEGEEAPKKKKGLFGLGALKNPLNSGEKKQTAEVNSAGAAKGVDPTAPVKSTGPINPALIEVKITKADLDKFRSEGGLKKGA